MNYSRYTKGYTLLFAVLTASLVLGIAAFIVGINEKQYLLASTARESTFAIYSADSGIECTLNTTNNDEFTSMNGGDIYCDNNKSTLQQNNPPSSVPNWLIGNSDNPIRQWKATLQLENNTCAVVTITTGVDNSVTPSIPTTYIDSRGYNVCKGSLATNDLSPDTLNKTIVERALYVKIGGISY